MGSEKQSDDVVVYSGLTRREEAAYRSHMKANEPPLAPSLQEQFFELYLQGVSPEKIARLNKGVRLGAIVRAFKEGDWYNKRIEYLRGIIDSVKQRAMQAQVESVLFLGDVLAAAHKLHGERVKRYLQTGDVAELGGLSIDSFKEYRMVLEMLLRATGQDGGRSSTSLPPPSVPASTQTPGSAPKALESGGLSMDEAGAILLGIGGKSK